MIINNNFEEPFNKFPTEDYIPIISRPLVNSKLTNKFWNITKDILDKTLKEDIVKLDEKSIKNNKYNINKQIEDNINNYNNYNNKIIFNENKENEIHLDKGNENNNNINEEEEKKKYIELCKELKLKNEKYDEIILIKEEENKLLVKKIEELEKIINNKINMNKI